MVTRNVSLGQQQEAIISDSLCIRQAPYAKKTCIKVYCKMYKYMQRYTNQILTIIKLLI